jgi:hypothetical protein
VLWVFILVFSIVVSLGFGTSLAWVLLPKLKLPSKRPDHENPQRKPDEGNTDENYPYRPSADFIALINAVRNEAHANRREARREDRGKRRREITTIVLIALTLAAVIAQVREMIRVYEPIKEQAEANNKAANAAAAAQRAWVGPTTATANTVEKGKSVVGIIPYQNTGREPAASFYGALSSKLYSLDDWNNGIAAKDITDFSSDCFKVTNLPNGLQVIYPTTGGITSNGYQIQFDTERAEPKIVVNDDIINGQTIFTIKGCFTYKTIQDFHHSAFCYFYLAKFSTLPNLSICNVGNDAN